MRVTLLLLGAAGAAAASKCSDYTGCSECINSNDDQQPGDELCFWCYAPANASAPSCRPINQHAITREGMFGGCKDLSMDAYTCNCNPGHTDTCSSCARPDAPRCVWMDAGTTTKLSLDVTIALGQKTLHIDFPAYELPSGRCWPGTGFGPDGLRTIVDLTTPLVDLTARFDTTPSKWFWAQCQLPRAAMASMIIALSCTCAACLGLCCARRAARRRRARQADGRVALLVGAAPVAVGRPM